jgi:hypothetical protein
MTQLGSGSTSGSNSNANFYLTVCAIIGALAMIFAPIAGEATKKGPPPQLTQTCLELQQRYAEAVLRSPADRERILPGVDGQSTLLRDPQAKYCDIRPEDFR